ncbi:MAG: hypothetical protein ACR2G6_07815 [Gemmatimonadaceae bacterium]
MREPGAYTAGSLLAALLCSACGGGSGDTAGTAASRTSDTAVAATATAPSAPIDWAGTFSLGGTLEGGRQADGTLEVAPMAQGLADFERTRSRVRQTYPEYAGPLFLARLRLGGNGDSTRGEFTCALGPSAESPPLVCEPKAPIRNLSDATLVVQANGRAVLTGSHGEGVSIEYGRFTWRK